MYIQIGQHLPWSFIHHLVSKPRITLGGWEDVGISLVNHVPQLHSEILMLNHVLNCCDT